MFIAFPNDLYVIADQLNARGDNHEELRLLNEMFNEKAPQASTIWRIARAQLESIYANKSLNKKEKIQKYDESLKFIESYLKIAEGSQEEQGFLLLYYTMLMSSKIEISGIKNALDTIPIIKEQLEEVLQFDPTNAKAYFLLAKLDEELPSFMGGNKYRMGMYFEKAHFLAPKDITTIHDMVIALYKRNWSAQKKQSFASKEHYAFDGHDEKSDRERAKSLIEHGINIYPTIKQTTVHDRNYYEKLSKLKLLF